MSEPITVLSIHWGFSPGGIGKYACLLNSISATAPVDIVSLCIMDLKWPCDYSGLKKLNANRIILRARFDISWIPKVADTIRKIRPDLIMSHGFNGHFVTWVSSLWSGLPIPRVCSYHGRYHATTPQRRFFEKSFNLLTEHYIRHRTQGTVTVADYSKDYLVERRIDPDTVCVIHNGIEDEKPTPGARERLRRQWNVHRDEVLIGAASRLDPVKGLEFAIDAVARLARLEPHIRFAIIGAGRSEEQLKARVKALGLSTCVIFTGFRSDIVDCLEAFDIFVLPSLAEYHSIALLEAMRSGKAIVATDVGGNKESVNNDTEGLIVPAADANALAAALSRLVKDEKLRVTLGANARNRFVTHFTVDVMVQKTAEWFQRCAAMR
jgi:glycosyltransferase involved in cell wall biosynthesis